MAAQNHLACQPVLTSKLIKNYMGCQTGLDLLGREFSQEMMSECLQVTLQG